MTDDPVVGHKTRFDGSHEPLLKSEADAIMVSVRNAKQKRRKSMPTTQTALAVLCEAKERLKELGWRNGAYCPKDGTSFAVCEFGSTGMWKGFYCGKWPDGHIISGDCVHHPDAVMFKLLASLTSEEAETMKQCDAQVSATIAGMGVNDG